MHPAEVLIQLHLAAEAGAHAPFSASCAGFPDQSSCQGCPATSACDFISNQASNLPPNNTWDDALHSYCSTELDKSFDQLCAEYPEFLI